MNKTININLGGFFFHIDEIAYQKLRKYLDAISKSLSEDPQGKEEIIADIEARISELLSEKITDTRQVINEGDIDDIIKIMGQPEDYVDAEEPYTNTNNSGSYSNSSNSKNSNYSTKKNNASTKKLFRDGEDKFLGGVASGIAHYFNVDTIWIRLGLILLFSSAGFGILLYIILWVLLPEAKTTAEKLQMQGEPVNIDNIEKKIRQEFNNVSEKVNVVANQASEKIREGANDFSDRMNKTFSGKGKKNNSLGKFFTIIGNILSSIFKVFGKFIGVIIIFISGAVILSLIIGGFSIGSLSWLDVEGDYLQYPPFFYGGILPKSILTISAFLLIGIPFLSLLIFGLRILSSNVRKISKPSSLVLSGMWVVSLLAMIFAGLNFGISHSKYGKVTEKKILHNSTRDTLKLMAVNNDNIYYQHQLKRSNHKHEVTVKGIKMVYSNLIKVHVKNSNSDKNYMVIQKDSKGKTRSKAKRNAKKIRYNYTIKNNTIVLDAFFLSNFKNLWKDEEINITFYLKEQTPVFFDNSIKNFLYKVDNKQKMYDKDMGNHYFIMTNKTLKCTDCIVYEKEVEKKINTDYEISDMTKTI